MRKWAQKWSGISPIVEDAEVRFVFRQNLIQFAVTVLMTQGKSFLQREFLMMRIMIQSWQRSLEEDSQTSLCSFSAQGKPYCPEKNSSKREISSSLCEWAH